jgi:transposase-like protein
MAKSNLPLEERMRHAETQINSSMSQAEYAKSVGLPASMIGYWVKQYREKHGILPNRRTLNSKSRPEATPKQELTRDELGDARAEIASLTFIREELMGKLEDAYTKIRSLQSVIVILGHQVGDE